MAYVAGYVTGRNKVIGVAFGKWFIRRMNVGEKAAAVARKRAGARA